jgi:hypothetical protein
LLEMARDHCPPAVKDIEHAIFAAPAAEAPRIYACSSRNNPKLSSTGRSVTEKIIAGSFFDVF